MPITPRAVQEGIKKGHNSLGLEDAGDRVLGSKFCREFIVSLLFVIVLGVVIKMLTGPVRNSDLLWRYLRQHGRCRRGSPRA